MSTGRRAAQEQEHAARQWQMERMMETSMMLKHVFVTTAALSLVAVAQAAPTPAPPAVSGGLSAAQIVEKNVAARGGLAAWHGVQSMTWKGKLGAGATSTRSPPAASSRPSSARKPCCPSRFEFKRPQKTRLEIQFKGQTAVQVFDGAQGWKQRPYLGRSNWDAYTADEVKQAAAEPGIDGFLIDYAARGARVELAGTEKVEDRDTYKLKVTLRRAARCGTSG